MAEGANREALTKLGETPLHVASKYPGGNECVSKLCDSFCNVNSVALDRSTPLISAASFGYENVVRTLVRAGADRKIRDESGECAADAAKNSGHAHLAACLRDMAWPDVDAEQAQKWNISAQTLASLMRARNVQELLDDPNKEELNNGFGGIVYLCNDHGASVVVKCLGFGNSISTEETRKMLLEEAKILFNLRHPHIVQLLGVSDAPPAIVLENAMFGSLSDMLGNFTLGEIPLSCQIWFCSQISSGLEYLHSEGVFYRDLKAANVLVFSGFTLKLADFGLSKTLNFRTRRTAAAGTISHIAPECFEEIFSFSSDVYALAVTFWEVATCQAPWADFNMRAILQSVPKGVRPSLGQVEDPLRGLISDCWQTDRTLRPSASMTRKRLGLMSRQYEVTRAEIRALEDKVLL